MRAHDVIVDLLVRARERDEAIPALPVNDGPQCMRFGALQEDVKMRDTETGHFALILNPPNVKVEDHVLKKFGQTKKEFAILTTDGDVMMTQGDQEDIGGLRMDGQNDSNGLRDTEIVEVHDDETTEMAVPTEFDDDGWNLDEWNLNDC